VAHCWAGPPRGERADARRLRNSLIAGWPLAVILLAGCVVLALLRPQPGLADAPILMEKQVGASTFG